jgi:hypothetical protein
MTMWKVGLVLMLLAAPLGAQERRVEDMSLPGNVADSLVRFFNAPTTIRFRGLADVPAGRSIIGDVAVLGGPFTIAGTVQGNVLVMNGDLVVQDQGHVSGDVTVVGGSAHAATGAVGGALVVYSQSLAIQRRGSGIAVDERRRALDQLQYQSDYTRSRISLRTEGAYNRVEGFPVMFGPEVETRGDNVFRLDAMAIWRSESGFQLNTDKLGYMVRAEQRFGPEGEFSVGATAHSVVDPIERWGLSDIENSLSTFLLHEDYRDYYQRQGISAFAQMRLPFEGVRFTAEYRDEKQSYMPVGSPWTLRRNDAPWRPQPLVGEGRLQTIGAHLIVDARNDRSDPTDGWYLDARGTLGVGGSLTLPEYLAPAASPPDVVSNARSLGHDFTFGFLELRRYARLGPTSDLRLRGIVAGSLDRGSLPPQFQHALGGEGSLPGYSSMSVDCGARSRTYTVLQSSANGGSRVPAFASYGCDQIALFQAEYRGTLAWNLNFGPHDEWDDKWDWYPDIDLSPSWSVFFDAGKGWSLADPVNAPTLADTETLMDTGVGISLGELGFYWAWPLNGSNRSVNFFLRIDHRF